ncbi:MAG: hypothetical protein JOY78_21085 [Pseudonocardia sp.]|nr:hypothetical protein [Pseudonocardia sp.]
MAWTLAANCLLYEGDPGPARLNVGTAAEPRMVSRYEACRDFYARSLVKELEAGLARIDAVRAEYEIALVRRPTRRDRSKELPAVRHCAVELAQRAATIVRNTGAADDATERRRLLAGLDHQLMVETLGAIPQIVEDSTERLIERLNDINDED